MTTLRFDPTIVTRTELSVGGMNCGSCARHVETALAMIGNVSARVDLVAATAVVVHPATIAVRELVDAIEDAGYTVSGREQLAAG